MSYDCLSVIGDDAFVMFDPFKEYAFLVDCKKLTVDLKVKVKDMLICGVMKKHVCWKKARKHYNI